MNHVAMRTSAVHLGNSSLAQMPAYQSPFSVSPGVLKEEVDALFAALSKIPGLSDVTVRSDRPIVARIYGDLYAMTHEPLTHQTVMRVIAAFYGTGIEDLFARKRGAQLAATVAIPQERNRYARYRLQITSIEGAGGARAACIVGRLIDEDPPTFESCRLPPELGEAFLSVQNGLVLMTGATGSGKSKSIAALLRYLNEKGERSSVVTVEDPVEFIHRDGRSMFIQHEVGRDIESYEAGLRNALRQDPDYLYVGEMRTFETINAGLTMALTGHVAISTLHNDVVNEIGARLIKAYPAEMKEAAIYDFASVARLLIAQRLVKCTDGGRIPVLEWLVIDSDMRNALRLCRTPEELATALSRMVIEKGVSMPAYAERLLNARLIAEQTYGDIVRSYTSLTKEAKP